MLDSENIDMYAVLQVHPTAEPEIVDAAYRRLARMYHPDVNKSPGAHETMIRINLAYEIIGAPAKRAAYDRDRANRQQTEWQAWTERAERERRERSEQAERERQARADAERQRTEQERAEREQKERQAQANPTHQSYAEWEAEMQRQARANAERQRAERERQARANQEASTQSQQGKVSGIERGLPFRTAIVSGAITGAISVAIHAILAVLANFEPTPTAPAHCLFPGGMCSEVVLNFRSAFLGEGVIPAISYLGSSSGLLSLLGALGMSIFWPFPVAFQAPHPRKWRILFIKVVITAALILLSILVGLVGLLYYDEIILVVFSFMSGATFGIIGRLYNRGFPQNLKEFWEFFTK